MTESTDFLLPPEEPAETPGSGERPPQPPMIIIEYRNRGLLARLSPPLLILLATVGITSYQRRAPVPLAAVRPSTLIPKNGPPQHELRPNQDSGPDFRPSSPNPPQSPQASPAPLAGAPQGDPEAVVATQAVEPKTVFEFDPSDGLRPLDKAASPINTSSPNEPTQPVAQRPLWGPLTIPVPNAAEAPPVEGPVARREVTREEVLTDIQREAEQTKEEQRQLEEFKPRARALIVLEAVGRVNANRSPFRAELKQVLRAFGPKAGPEIDRVCTEFGRAMMPETQLVFQRALRTAPKRLSRADEVNLMRACALPEPVILDYLAHKLHKLINTRGGPRDENDVRIKAAQLLLATPLPNANQGTQTAAARAPVGRTPDGPDSPLAAVPSAPNLRP